MPLTHDHASESAILNRVLRPTAPGFSENVARAVLALEFAPEDEDRMRELSSKAQDGALSPAERDEINRYERVGHLINMLHSKARRSLNAGGGRNGKSEGR